MARGDKSEMVLHDIRGRQMEELIGRVSAAAGIEPDVAQKSIGVILNFLRKEGPAGPVGELMSALPGAEAAADSAAGGSGGMMGGGGLMALAGQLSSAGLGMGEMSAVGKELFAAAREKVGDDTIGEIAGAIPGLHQFI